MSNSDKAFDKWIRKKLHLVYDFTSKYHPEYLEEMKESWDEALDWVREKDSCCEFKENSE